jgi:hypothetical protein
MEANNAKYELEFAFPISELALLGFFLRLAPGSV